MKLSQNQQGVLLSSMGDRSAAMVLGWSVRRVAQFRADRAVVAEEAAPREPPPVAAPPAEAVADRSSKRPSGIFAGVVQALHTDGGGRRRITLRLGSGLRVRTWLAAELDPGFQVGSRGELIWDGSAWLVELVHG